MKALRRLTVRAALPEQLRGLCELVMNLRWSWHAPTRELFERVDPKTWQACAGDPVRLLGQVSSHRVADLAEDPAFLERPHAASDDLLASPTSLLRHCCSASSRSSTRRVSPSSTSRTGRRSRARARRQRRAPAQPGR